MSWFVEEKAFFYFKMSAKPVDVSQKTNLAPAELHYFY